MSIHQARLFLRIAGRNPEVYVLKVTSLAVAFGCLTLIALFTFHELGYDRFHPHSHQLYRLLQKNTDEHHHGNRLSNSIPADVIAALQARAGDAVIFARVKLLNKIDIIAPETTSRNQKIHAADVSIASIFGFQWEDGALSEFGVDPLCAIISSSASLEYFGTTQGAGKKIGIRSVDDTVVFRIAGVYKDFPGNSHERFNLFIPFEPSIIESLHFNPAKSGVYGRVPQVAQSYLDQLGKTISQTPKINYEFQSLTQIYLGPRVLGEDTRHGDLYSITLLIAITLLILFLALTTFINLTTLTLPHRSREIAVKKLAGISQSELNLGFAIESLAIVLMASLVGGVVLGLTSTFFERTLAIELIPLLLQNKIIVLYVWIAFFLLFGFAPVLMVLKFTRATPGRLLSTDTITFPQLQRVITFLQLGISSFLIVASLVIARQINYSLLKEPGRNHDQIVYLSFPKEMTDEGLRSLRAAWKNYHPNIVDVMASTQLPNDIKSKDLNSPFYFMSVDPAFADFFNINMLEGNWFKANAGDTIIVVNEEGMKVAGNATANIVGVFEDMSERFNHPEKPLRMNLARYYNFNFLCVRILEVDIRRTIGYLSNHFGEGKNKPVISFLDKNFERWLQYQDGLNTLSGILAIVSALLSCFAIYGLSISLVRDKLKQIALHKLFGASTFKITRLLFKMFARQALVALIVFGPLTYLILKELLRTFVYSTSIRLSDAVIPLVYCAVIIFLLCGFQARSLNRLDLTAALKKH